MLDHLFQCGSNPFDSDGAMEILQAVDVNDVSAVTLLDFSVSDSIMLTISNDVNSSRIR